MAKSDSTKGKGAQEGEAERATSEASPTRSPAKKTAAKKTAGKSAGTSAGKSASGGATAKKSPRSAGTSGAGGTASATPKKRAATGAARSAGAAGNAPAPGGGGLRDALRSFVSAWPQGWGHGEWLGLLDDLRGQGHDVSDTDSVGMALERERLTAVLEGVEELDSARVQALADRFQTLWSFRHASVNDIAAVPGMDRALAERVRSRA